MPLDLCSKCGGLVDVDGYDPKVHGSVLCGLDRCNKSVLENLKAARALIADPKNWIKNAYGRTAGGYMIENPGEDEPEMSEAVCFCALGAIRAVTGADHDNTYEESMLSRVVPQNHYGTIHLFNDDAKTIHDDVLALFDRAIIEAQKYV